VTSVGSILAGAFGLVRQHPLAVLVWGLLYVAAIAALLFAMRPYFQVYADLFSQLAAYAPDRQLKPEDLQPYMARLQAASGTLFLAEIGLFAFIMVLFTATQRAVLRPNERAFFFLRLGGDELRMIGLAFFFVVCLYIGSILAMLALLIVFGIIFAVVVASTSSPAIAGLILSVALLVLIGGTIYVEVRFSLAFPLTFMRRSFVVGEAWRLTKGRFWSLFGAYFAIALVYLVLASVLVAFAVAPFFLEMSQAGNTPGAFQLAVQHQMERFATINAANVGLCLGAVLLCGLTLALFGGAMARAVRDLVPDGEGGTAG